MAEVPDSWLEHYEGLVRENLLLRQRAAELEPAVGHFSVLVRMAAALRAWRRDGTIESKQQAFDLLDEYDGSRPAI